MIVAITYILEYNNRDYESLMLKLLGAYKYYLLTLTLVIVATVATTFFVVNNQQKVTNDNSSKTVADEKEDDNLKIEEIIEEQPTPVPETIPVSQPSELLTYEDSTFGIKFKYPQNYSVEVTDTNGYHRISLRNKDYILISGIAQEVISITKSDNAVEEFNSKQATNFTRPEDQNTYFTEVTIDGKVYQVKNTGYREGGPDGDCFWWGGKNTFINLVSDTLISRTEFTVSSKICDAETTTTYTPAISEIENVKLILESIEFI